MGFRINMAIPGIYQQMSGSQQRIQLFIVYRQRELAADVIDRSLRRQNDAAARKSVHDHRVVQTETGHDRDQHQDDGFKQHALRWQKQFTHREIPTFQEPGSASSL